MWYKIFGYSNRLEFGEYFRSGDVLDDIGFLYKDHSAIYSAGEYKEDDRDVEKAEFDENDPPSEIEITWVVDDNWFGSIVTSIKITSQEGKEYGPYGTKKIENTETKKVAIQCGVLGLLGYRNPKDHGGQVSFVVIASDPPSHHLGM